jgi:hypothetical protein
MVWPKFDDLQFYDENLLLEPPTFTEQLEADWRTLRGEEPGPQELPRLPADKLKEFVLGVCDNSIFLSSQVRERSLVHLVFLPLALGALKEWDDDSLKKIGVVYEYYDQSLPRSINGMPIFGSCRMLHIDDWKIAMTAINREIKRRKDIKIDLNLETKDP